MKRKKYGEDTVVIRVPASKKEAVLKFLEQFEVIDLFASSKLSQDISKNAVHNAYMQGFMDCFNAWEDYHYSSALILTGNEEHLPMYLDLVNGRVPPSLHQSTLETITNVFVRSNKKFSKIESQFSKLDDLLEDSFSKAKVKAELFTKQAQISSNTQPLGIQSDITDKQKE